jgi:hypothetical protein
MTVLFLTLSLSVWSQQSNESYAFIIYAEGYNVSVFRNEELTAYDVMLDDVIGMPLMPGDLVQTDDDTFIEMQVMPSRTVVKIAENTTFEIQSIGGAGGGSFNISYGRLRARVERVTQNDRFEIRGFTAVAGVRGTDFGYDMVVERAGASELDVAELQTKVYVFDGEVEVTENVADTPPSEDGTEGTETPRVEPTPPAEPQAVTLQANEMVNVVSAAPVGLGVPLDEQALPDGSDGEEAPAPEAPAPRTVVFRQETIETEIQEFWTRRDFREEAVDPDRVEERFPGINARVQQLSEERRQYQELQRLRREGLLGSPQELLARTGEIMPEEEPEREPQTVSLNPPGSNERIERILLPQDAAGEARQLQLAGHWMVGLGLVMEVAGLAGAWYVDDARSVQDLGYGGPSTGAMIGGGVFITSGLLSYLFSLFAAD